MVKTMDKPRISINVGTPKDSFERKVAFVLIEMTCECPICPRCEKAIWPTHYYPRGVVVETVRDIDGLTHGHEGNELCDLCNQAIERINADMMRAAEFAAEPSDTVPESHWSASYDESIVHETEYNH